MNSGQQQVRTDRAQGAKLHDELSNLLGSKASYSVQTSKQLSVDVEDAQISHVSQEKVENMWKKAEELLTFDRLVLVLWIPLDKLPAYLPLNQEARNTL